MTVHIQKLISQIKAKKSLLCVGLDPDINKIPQHFLSSPEPIFSFNKAIIDATAPFAVAFKPNIAFYEALGISGWASLEKTIDYINSQYPEIFTIADAKRADIGNTAAMYAKAFFQTLNFDSVTLSPYMGYDSIAPFLQYENKSPILLALTSNPSAADFQLKGNPPLFMSVISSALSWPNSQNIMFVVGATKTDYLAQIRKIAPSSFLLVPGVGSQGGDLNAVCSSAITPQGGLLINASRSIIYASSGTDFDQKAAAEAQKLQSQMASFL